MQGKNQKKFKTCINLFYLEQDIVLEQDIKKTIKMCLRACFNEIYALEIQVSL